MKVAFRVDASVQIGTGHFMRCLTLADALKKRGAHIRFVSRHLPECLLNMLALRAYEAVLLDSGQGVYDELAHAHWLGCSQSQDAADSLKVLSDNTWDWLVVDHYALDSRWESTLRSIAKNILVIDDIADRQHDCDVLLDQNYYVDMDARYAGKVPSHCQLLLGPRYALLRDEFHQLRERCKPRVGIVKGVLVFFGGVDADNYTGRTVKVLANLGLKGVHVDVVIGAQHPCRDELEQVCSEHHFKCHVQTNRMAELMAAADLAIGAGGSATWERCCLGLPTLTVSLADNQITIAKSLDLLDAGQYMDSWGMASDADMQKTIIDLLQNRSKLEMFSRESYSIVDGLGVSRLCKALLC